MFASSADRTPPSSREAEVEVLCLQLGLLRVLVCVSDRVLLNRHFQASACLDRQQLDFGRWHATRSSIVLEQYKLQLSLPASKTDPFRQGVTLTIAAAGDEACPVASLRYLSERFPSLPSAPLFETALGFNRQLVNV
jgi:hypothetical protein